MKIIEKFCTIPKDKLLHDMLGVHIAAFVFIASFLLARPFTGSEVAFAGAMTASVVCVMAAALWKDFVYDTRPDWVDIVVTIAGGIPVWAVAVTVYLAM